MNTDIDNTDKSLQSIAYQVFVILDASVTNETDVGDTKFYNEYKNYMIVQGYDTSTIKKVWNIIENEYL